MRKLESELVAITKEKKELADDNFMADKVVMLMQRMQEAEEKMRTAQQERAPLKRENNALKQELKLLQAQAQKAERHAKDLEGKLIAYNDEYPLLTDDRNKSL